jgi:hypothetical protein
MAGPENLKKMTALVQQNPLEIFEFLKRHMLTKSESRFEGVNCMHYTNLALRLHWSSVKDQVPQC